METLKLWQYGGALLLVLLILSILWWLVSRRPQEPKTVSIEDMDWPYVAREFMTAPERIFYIRLRQALPDYLIFAQVQLSRLIDVRVDAENQGWLNRINRMSVDFVICAPDGAMILAAIELDDSSHQRPERQKADAKKDRALQSAGIRIIRWPVKGMPDAREIRATFLQERKPQERKRR